METDFLYSRRKTPIGVKVEEVGGAEQRTGRVWELMAKQVYQENGRDGYRAIDHTPEGVPLLEGSDERISVSHTDGLLVVATLPPTPEADLTQYSPRTALGVDTEAADRDKPRTLRERFLNPDELVLVPDTVEASVVAWTAKEALYKAALTPGLDWREDIRITRLPATDDAVSSLRSDHNHSGNALLGAATVRGQEYILYTYKTTGVPGGREYVVTLAITPQTATYRKKEE